MPSTKTRRYSKPAGGDYYEPSVRKAVRSTKKTYNNGWSLNGKKVHGSTVTTRITSTKSGLNRQLMRVQKTRKKK